jgi:hypothetical protein
MWLSKTELHRNSASLADNGDHRRGLDNSSREVQVGLVFNDERLHRELDDRTSAEVEKADSRTTR